MFDNFAPSNYTATPRNQFTNEPFSSPSTCSAGSAQNPTKFDFNPAPSTVIQNVYERALNIYMSGMNEFLENPEIYLTQHALREKHEENRSKVIDFFFQYSEQCNKSKSQVSVKMEVGQIQKATVKTEIANAGNPTSNFDSKLSELLEEIDRKFENYREKNELKRSKVHSFVHGQEKKETSKMSKLIDSCTSENEKEVTENQVKPAFDTAKKYYSEEMEKETSSKDLIEPAELVKLDKKVLEQALKTCDDLKLTLGQEKELKEALGGIFKNYQDKNLLRRPNINISPAIGIDLGTTNSCVAIYRNGKVEVIHDENGHNTTPSFVSFQDDGSVIVGDGAKDQSYLNPENTIFDAKRLIGRNFEDEKVQENIKLWSFEVIKDAESGRPKIQVAVKKPDESDCPPAEKQRKTSNSNKSFSVETKTYHCEEISALVLRKMKKIAEDYLGVEVKDAVITVLALFNDYQRQATRNAGEIAGLNVLRLINEPTAASIAYNLHRTDELKKNVLVFDLGGGTLDVVVLEIAKGEITVKSVHGDTHLGGQDFDSEMIKYCIDFFKNQHGIDLARDQESKIVMKRFDASSRLRRIRIECEKEKKFLSSYTKRIIGIKYIESKPKLLDLHVSLTREKFESLNQKNFDRCLEIVQLALDEAKMNKDDIDDVVLVGGSTRIPKIQKMLSDFFGGKTLCKSINPDQVVAEGAAIQACILSGQGIGEMEEIKLNDVTPFSIGISAVMDKIDDGFSVIIPKNTVVPCEQTRDYYSDIGPDDSSAVVSVRIFEGEDKVASKNNLIGRFLLENGPVPTKKAERIKQGIKVTMKIDKEGMLRVRAEWIKNGESNEILIKTLNSPMTRKEIEDAKVSVNSLME